MFSSSSDDEIDRNNQNNARRRRIFRERIDTEFESIVQFNERFRMSHENLELLLNDIGHFLRRATNRSMALSEKNATLCSFTLVGDWNSLPRCWRYAWNIQS